MAPTEFDALDRKVMQALQLDGRAPFRRIAEVLGVSDQTVARRYRRLCGGGTRLRVLGMVDQNRVGRTSWIVRLRCTPDAAERLAEALARRPDTSYVALESGGTEVVTSMRPRSREARDELLLHQLQRTPRILSVSAHCILHMFYGGASGWLSKIQALTPEEESALRPPPVDPSPEPVELDDVDERLLAVLYKDGRASLGELQSATAQSESVVRHRLDQLRSRGILYYDVQYDSEPLGTHVEAMLWLTVAPSALAAAGRALAGHPEVSFAAATTGSANLVAATQHRSGASLYSYLSERIGALEGVYSVETALTLRQVKQLNYEPMR
ncbi:winged helix-turn-helix transcriptional regulator [Streptomyces sp. NPDC004539]|uniref:Lrp/AsnC family transcriptional regulator n=1 Tax=Streptomyces sp. NPDC004539 TaxID=3154280 RepID=UPI0033A4755E